MLQMFSRFCSLALLGLLALGVNDAHAAKWFSDYNHPDLDWYTIEGEHFIVHYQVSKRSVAEGNDHFLTGEWSARQSAQVADEM